MPDARTHDPLDHIVGNITRAPVEKETSKGQVVEFGLAVNKSYDGSFPTVFYDVAVWNEGLQASVMQLYKGAKVAVEGWIKSREYSGKTYWQITGTKVFLCEPLTRTQSAPKVPESDPFA